MRDYDSACRIICQTIRRRANGAPADEIERRIELAQMIRNAAKSGDFGDIPELLKIYRGGNESDCYYDGLVPRFFHLTSDARLVPYLTPEQAGCFGITPKKDI